MQSDCEPKREERGKRKGRISKKHEIPLIFLHTLILPSFFPYSSLYLSKRLFRLTGTGLTHIMQLKEITMFGSFGIWEILLIVVVIALLFGGKKLPELGKGLGQGIKNFKNAVKGEDKDKEEHKDEKDN